MNRNLDGVYFRMRRGDKFDNICFSDLDEVEMKEVLKNRSTEWLTEMCLLLGKTIRNIGDQLDLSGNNNE